MPAVSAVPSVALLATLRATSAISFAVSPADDVEFEFELRLFDRLKLPFRTGNVGSACDIAFIKPLTLKLLSFGGSGRGRGAAIHGDNRHSFQVLMSKKSTGYSSLVYLLMKHFPSSGSKA